MTFLLFLASLAVLNYVIRKSGEAAAESHHSPASPENAVQPVATPGLLALGHALEQHGRGQAPVPAEARELQKARVTSPSEP